MASIPATAPALAREKRGGWMAAQTNLQTARVKAGTRAIEIVALLDMLRVIGIISILLSILIAIEPAHPILLWMRGRSLAFHPQTLINIFLLCGIYGVLATQKWRSGLVATLAMLPFAFLVWQVAHYLITTSTQPPLLEIGIDVSFLCILAMWYLRGYQTRDLFERNIQLTQEALHKDALIHQLQAEVAALKPQPGNEVESSAPLSN